MAFFKIFKRWIKDTPIWKTPVRENLDVLMNIMEYSDGIDRGSDAASLQGIGWTFGNKRSITPQLPQGDATNVAFKWDNTENKWTVVKPIEDDDDEVDGNLESESLVVVGAKTSTEDDTLIQLQVKKLPNFTTLVSSILSTISYWPPSGWEEETLNVVTEEGILTRTVLVKTATKDTVKTFASTDERLLLQVDDGGKLTIDRGYFKA